MSLDSGLFVYIQNSFDAMQVIECYVNNGLNIYNPQQKVQIISSNDDSFDWDDLSITYNQLKEIVDYKQRHDFPIGISFFEGDIYVTNLLIKRPNTLILNCDINRKTVRSGDGFEFTDVNWYIEKFIIPLIKNNFNISSFEFREVQ